MNYFKKVNLWTGWGVFLISAIVYILTLEPSASLWDCSEFIATSYKLEVGHPPGAPFFMMINRLFSMFAPDQSYVAAAINFGSAMASALTIAFLFWTISHLGLRLVGKAREELTKPQIWLNISAAFIGSMAYAFTDTFWFSAVEGEVYAQSSLFTAIVFWAMLKWENEADSPHATRWIILVAYLMGLSIGVHLLNLLTIPALVLIYYYRKVQNKSRLGWWKAFGVSVLILAFVLFGVVPKIPAIGAWFDRIFVNSFSLPVNSGFVFFFFLLMGLLCWGIYYTHQKGRVVMNTAMICLTMLVVGYSSYASVVIRAMANPPMNSNSPSDPYALLSLLNRDQYGQVPLVTGPYYSSTAVATTMKTVYRYNHEQKKYVEQEMVSDYEYAPGTTTIFPRMYDPSSANAYSAWVDIKGRSVQTGDKRVIIPTFAENLEYFFNYQLRYMYWRYFLWNFVGRQNDIPGRGDVINGNWLSGVKFIDEFYLGNQDGLPDVLSENKGRNTYFFLPFLFGLAGLFYQLRRDKNNFNIVMFLFLMTGVAIILYLNQPPRQPRERDYAFAGSFYAFSIWIGLGVYMLHNWLGKIKSAFMNDRFRVAMAALIGLSVPTILLAQNWDDHSRANRYIARDMGANYLNSTLPGSVLLPFGDNDTFPLWYNQEVEGVRTDVKISNMSYLDSDWYSKQMLERTYEADGFKLTLPYSKFYGKNDAIYIVVISDDKAMSVIDALMFVKNDSKSKKDFIRQNIGEDIEILPTRKLFLPVNKENAIKSGIVKPEDAHLMVDTIEITIPENLPALKRSEYMVLDLIATADWSRPIYFTQPIEALEKFGLHNYLQHDGIAYRLTPIYTPAQQSELGRIDVDYMYNKLMNEFKYGNISDTTVYTDYFVRYTYEAADFRGAFVRLAAELLKRGDKDKAQEVLRRSLKEIPHSQVPVSGRTIQMIDMMFNAELDQEAAALMMETIEYYLQHVEYYSKFSQKYVRMLQYDFERAVTNLYFLYQIGLDNGKEELVKNLQPYAQMVIEGQGQKRLEAE